MPNAQVTPGYVFSSTPPPGELVTYAKLNQLGNPVVTIPAQTPSSGINYLRNGNFYTQSWTTPSGLSCPTSAPLGTVNALYWECLPAGAAITYAQDTRVPNAFSIYSTKLTGATSATTVFFQQQIQSDFSAELTQNVTFSCWIFNATGSSISPVLNINTAAVKDVFVSQASFVLGATANLQTCPNNAWTQVSATLNLSAVAGMGNGIQVQVSLPSGALASGTQSINFSQMQLITGSGVSSQFVDDYTFSLPPSPFAVSNSLGFAPLSEGIINSVTNGSFDVAQLGTSFAGVTAGFTRIHDCWLIIGSGSWALTASQSSLASTDAINSNVPYMPWKPFAGNLSITTAEASLAAGDYGVLVNRIEGYDITNLLYRPMSLSFWVKSSITGTFCIAIQNVGVPPADRSLVLQYTISNANTWQLVQFPNLPAPNNNTGTWNITSGLGLSINFVFACGATLQTSTVGSWINGNFIATSSQTNLAATNGNSFTITGVQLEPGTLCSQFQYIPFDRQLFKCQRYLARSYDYGTATGTANANGAINGFASQAGFVDAYVKFPATMRVAPTVTAYSSVTGTAANARDVIGAADRSVTSIGGVTTLSFSALIISAGLTAATSGYTAQGQFHYVADARL